MDEIKILTNEELGLYDEFSLSFNPKTKKDYLLKIIQFKKFLEGKDLSLYVYFFVKMNKNYVYSYIFFH